jgi:rubrerythrin
LPLNPRLEKLRVDLEGELEKKAERRDRYLEAAELAKDKGFPEVHEKLRALAEDEESHSKVLREILAELH